MTTPLIALPAPGSTADKALQRLVVEMMTEDVIAGYDSDARNGELGREIDQQLGDGACDRLADKVTGWHMTGVEAVLWAATGWDDCRRWLSGELNLDNGTFPPAPAPYRPAVRVRVLTDRLLDLQASRFEWPDALPVPARGDVVALANGTPLEVQSVHHYPHGSEDTSPAPFALITLVDIP